MILRIIDHKFHYEAENLCRVFFPFEKIVTRRDYDGEDNLIVVTELSQCDDNKVITVSFNNSGVVSSDKKVISTEISQQECEKQMMIMLFHILSDSLGYIPKWGILTGVRPSKLMTTLIHETGDKEAVRYFKDELLVDPNKTELAYAVAKAEEKIISLSDADSFSLYISIPFCPSRCNYCSFVSHSVEQAKKLIPDYVDNLCKEIEYTAQIANDLNLRLESVYWGGGTPTTLSADQLLKICGVINKYFDLSKIREYTVEAGRPDTITEDKLSALKQSGVSRISINPQTFNDEVLNAIGRRHTSAQTFNAFEMARKAGFNNINMDLIAGLSCDTYDSFCNTLDTAISLNPENITLHTLALKRSSNLVTGKKEVESGETVNRMLTTAQERFSGSGYMPYYMYRQSRSLGNLENVGWCKPGKECLYNVFMMEECHTVLAVGAGAVTKLKEYGVNNIDRIFNYKYPYEYNTRFDEIIKRKGKIYEFYDKYFKR